MQKEKFALFLWNNFNTIILLENLKLKHMKLLVLCSFFLVLGKLNAQVALGEVIGEVIDFNQNIGLVDAHVFIDDNGKRYQAKTDIDGRFRISAIPAGTYLVNIRKGNDTIPNIIAEVPMDGFANIGKIYFGEKFSEIGETFVTHRKNEIKLIDGNLPVKTLTAEEIDKSPLKFNIKGLVSSMTTDVQLTDDGQLVFRGARKGDMIYLIDGVKTADAGNVPGASIGHMMVYTGGLPAKYGDTLGGVVVMESKSYFDLYRSWEAEQLKKGLK